QGQTIRARCAQNGLDLRARMTSGGKLELLSFSNHCHCSLHVRGTELFDGRFHLEEAQKLLQIISMGSNVPVSSDAVVIVSPAVLFSDGQGIKRVRGP